MKALLYIITTSLVLALISFVAVCLGGNTDLTYSFIESREHNIGLGLDFHTFIFLTLLLVSVSVMFINLSIKASKAK